MSDNEQERDEVTVVRAYDGQPGGNYPPKGVVKEIEVRYGITTRSVDWASPGKLRVRGVSDR